jgi:hypothetical protein
MQDVLVALEDCLLAGQTNNQVLSVKVLKVGY